MKTSGIFFMVVGLGLGSCAPPTVPNRPSWDDDVFPILAGSCNHCHGETVGNLPTQPAFRYDVCDVEPMREAGIAVPPNLPGIGGALAPTLGPYVKSATGGRAPMPPPPADELSDYERDVLLKWIGLAPEDRCRRVNRNRPPALRVIGEPEWDGNDLKIEIDVSDPDRDQVLGKVSVGQASTLIPSVGRRVITVVGAERNQPINVLLHDGVEERTIDNL